MTTDKARVLASWFVFAVSAASTAGAQVTPDRLVNASREPQQWMTYSGTYDGTRYTALDQINRTNVDGLALQWVFQTGVRGQHDARDATSASARRRRHPAWRRRSADR